MGFIKNSFLLKSASWNATLCFWYNYFVSLSKIYAKYFSSVKHLIAFLTSLCNKRFWKFVKVQKTSYDDITQTKICNMIRHIRCLDENKAFDIPIFIILMVSVTCSFQIRKGHPYFDIFLNFYISLHFKSLHHYSNS